MRADLVKGARKAEASQPLEAEEIPAQQVREQLQRILASERFAHSDRLRRFLHHVVEETLSGRQNQLKEYTIGIAVFDRDPAFDPRTDPTVRVEAGRLRSRLSEYYSADGVQDPLIIEIPKGSYFCTIRRRSEEPIRRFDWVRRLHWVLDWRFGAILIVAGLAAVLAVQNWSLRRQAQAFPVPPIEATPIWEPFLSSQADTVIVFGSPLFFESEQRRLFVRQYDVNDPVNRFSNPSYQNLERLLGPLSEPRYMYAQTGEALALHHFAAFLGRYAKRTRALPANVATWDAIKNSNVICIGPARMNPILKRLPVEWDFELQPDSYVLNRRPQPGEPMSYYTPSHRDAWSYAVIASVQGLSPERELLIVTSHSSAGTQAAAEYLTSEATLRELAGKLQARLGGKRSYQILLRILADHDQGFKTEYVTHHSARQFLPKR
ncbi:MAG: hypothetical protein ACM3VX_08160 [Bacteroidota bacterium]